ncbi:hypothetical protein DESA109040_03490 [Deinococcus saxicola]|uniref:AAA family ATPase n=1 Tax=Deinococcus saxicola TaxID=249406 RepID=UPI0039EE8404
MITKIEIDGYKSFENFEIELEPFTVVAGVNGVGKSNLFDAVKHIGRIATLSLREAFETERGSLENLFTAYPDGKRAKIISYAVELLLPNIIVDQFSESVKLSYLRLRYEVSISYSEKDYKLNLESEKLLIIKRNEDKFLSRHKRIRSQLPRLTGGRSPFIDTSSDEKNNTITISQDGRAGNKRTVNAEGAFRTIMSSITTVEFPHAFAVKTLLENVHFLQLNPEKIRLPSDFSATDRMASDGEFLASSLRALGIRDRKLFKRISNDISYIVPGIKSLNIIEDEKRQQYRISATHVDGYEIDARQLSDGTLRVLALLLIKYDSNFSGVIILEEPENGIHPGRIPFVIDILKSMTLEGKNSGISKQIIINTHSSKVLRSVDTKNIAMAYTRKRVNNRGIYSITDVSYVSGELLSPTTERVAFNELETILNELKSDVRGI